MVKQVFQGQQQNQSLCFIRVSEKILADLVSGFAYKVDGYKDKISEISLLGEYWDCFWHALDKHGANARLCETIQGLMEDIEGDDCEFVSLDKQDLKFLSSPEALREIESIIERLPSSEYQLAEALLQAVHVIRTQSERGWVSEPASAQQEFKPSQ